MQPACRAHLCCGALWWYGIRVLNMRTFRERHVAVAGIITATSGRRNETRSTLLRWAALRISHRCTLPKDATILGSIWHFSSFTRIQWSLPAPRKTLLPFMLQNSWTMLRTTFWDLSGCNLLFRLLILSKQNVIVYFISCQMLQDTFELNYFQWSNILNK